MGLLNMWREARGNVMRKELDDILKRIEGANHPARSAFLNNISQTIDRLRAEYSQASPSDRKAMLKQGKKVTLEMWQSGMWPSALGAAISFLNVESAYVPGADAAYVKAETDKLIQEANEFYNNQKFP